MPDKNISQLPIASVINATDISVLVDGGTDYQYTFTVLLQFLAANLTIGAHISFGATLPQNTSGNNGDVFVNTASASFAQKVSGAWTIVYSLPAANAADGTLLYGAGLPGAGTGKNQDSYINTLTGIFYSKLSGSWAQIFSMATGPQGPQGTAGTNGTNGANGNTVSFGTTNPSNSGTGANGDFYINTTTLYIFGPKAGGVWPSGTSLIGATGAGVISGGTAGQILKKIDGTDFNTAWEDFSFANLSGGPASNANLATALTALQTDITSETNRAEAAETVLQGTITAETTRAEGAEANKVDKVSGYGLSSNDYTSTEKTKLANLNNYFTGVFASAAALTAAHPSGSDGQYAVVESAGTDAVEYIWDTTNNLWAAGGTGSVTSVNSQTGAVSLSTDNIGEGSTNLYFTIARVLASALTGIGFSTSTAVAATDTLLAAVGKLQAQITALFKIPAGGTAGQVLAKIDSTNGNTQWVAPASGPAGATGATGPAGAAGTNGNTVNYGAFNPTSGTGNNGDFFINTATNYIYGPKAAGAWPAGVSLIGPAGAGLSGLTAKQILYGNLGGTASQSANLVLDPSTGAVYVGNPTAAPMPSGSIVFFGTSIAAGVGVTGTGVRYSTQVAALMGLTENNLGTSGLHIQETTDGFGFQDKMSTVPAYSAGSTIWLVIETGPNDFNLYTGTGGTYQPTQYQTDLTSLINYFTGTKGWPVNKILILNNSYYLSTAYTATKTLTVYQAYWAATLAVATAKGTLFLDVNAGFAARGGDFLLYNTLHPNNFGHAIEANLVYVFLQPSTVYTSGQTLAVNGTAEFSNIKLDNPVVLSDGATIVGKDTSGNLAVLDALPANMRTVGNVYLGGQLIDAAANIDTFGQYGFTPGLQDWIKVQGSQIWGQFATNPAYYTSLVLCDAFVGFEFRTSWNSAANIMCTWYNGAGGTAMSLVQNGQLNVTNIYLPYGANGLFATAGGAVCGFIPFSAYGTLINNDYGVGFIAFQVSGGTTASLIEAARFAANGNFLIGITNDDGYKLSVNGTVRANAGLTIGSLANPLLTGNPVASTTGGSLAAGAYYCEVVAIDAFGNLTRTSQEGACTIVGSTGSATSSWAAITGAVSYRLYVGSTSGGENKYLTTTALSITDTGAGYTTGTPPTQNKTVLTGISNTGVISQSSPLATINGSTSGIAVFTQPFQGTTYKKAIVQLVSLNGTASYTFPTAFTYAPKVISGNDSLVTTLTTTGVIVTGSTTNDTVILEGY